MLTKQDMYSKRICWIEAPIDSAVLLAAGIAKEAIPDDAHVTVLFVGETADPFMPERLHEVMTAARSPGGIMARLSGHGRFLVGPRDFPVHVALVDSAPLCELHHVLRDAAGTNSEHGFTAHVTLLSQPNIPLSMTVLRQVPFTIRKIDVVHKFGSGSSKRYVRTPYTVG